MANSPGTLAGAVVIQRALELVFAKRPILRNITLNLRELDGSVTAKWNQTVYTRIKAIPTVQNFGTGAQDRVDTDVPVVLNQFKEVHHKFTVQEYSATDRDLIDESAEPMAVAVANHMVDAVAALWIAGNYPNQTVKASGHNYEHINRVRATLNGPTRGVPESKRFYAANGTVYENLLNDTLIVASLNNPSNADAIRTGRLPDVQGFGLAEYPNLPTTGNLVAFAGTPDSSIIAQRVPQNPEEILPGARYPGNIGIISEPTTGLSVMVTQWIDAASLDANTRLIWMYGNAVGNSNNGQRIVTA